MVTEEILARQRSFFATGATREESWRRRTLKSLRDGIEAMSEDIMKALYDDLGKSRTEAYMSEIGMVKSELYDALRHLHSWMMPKRARTPSAQCAASSRLYPDPYGCVLIMSPWNYPFLLSLDPVIAAIAAGNTVILKPSAYSPATSEVLKKLCDAYLPPEAVSVVTGGRQVNSDLLELKFDYIFFTGSKAVGCLVMEKAARYLTPVTLELGGKSPCIVDETAKIELAARRIVFGKYLNLGQTCVAPDYVLVQENVKDQLMSCLQQEIRRQFGEDPLSNPCYGHIINRKHYDRLCLLLAGETLLTAGGTVCVEEAEILGDLRNAEMAEPEIAEPCTNTVMNPRTLQIAPVLLTATEDSKCMQEEIFGPILPVLTYKTREDLIRFVESRPLPLACYVFTEDRTWKRKAMRILRFGGGCINDTVIHLASSNLPFGGVGESGMGAYHGKDGFDTFTHYKSVVDKKTWMDLPMRFQPYTDKKDKMIRTFLK